MRRQQTRRLSDYLPRRASLDARLGCGHCVGKEDASKLSTYCTSRTGQCCTIALEHSLAHREMTEVAIVRDGAPLPSGTISYVYTRQRLSGAPSHCPQCFTLPSISHTRRLK